MCMLLIYRILVITDAINSNHRMHNLYANFVNILEVCKKYSVDLENHLGNMSKCSVIPTFSSLLAAGEPGLRQRELLTWPEIWCCCVISSRNGHAKARPYGLR